MAKCKYCGQNISRLDKEICPFCGGKNPLDGTDTTTQDVTKVLGQYVDAKKIKHHSRILSAILALFLGFLGIHSFYLGKKKAGLITLAISASLIGIVGTILFFLTPLGVFAYLIPYFVIEIMMIIVAVSYLVRHDVTDANGEFLE